MSEQAPSKTGVARLSSIGQGLLDVLFPRNCLLSGEAVDVGDWHYFKRLSLTELGVVYSPHCTVCGYPFVAEQQGASNCKQCKQLVPVYQKGKTCLLLRGAARDLVHELKYHRGCHLLKDIGRIVREVPGFVEHLSDAVLVPVPLHARKLRERGYNQSELLAETFAAEAKGSAVQSVLRRVKDTPTQTRLDFQARRRNVAQAFALHSQTELDPNIRYVMVDDVFTTGATLNECAAVLIEGGAKHVDVATLGHG